MFLQHSGVMDVLLGIMSVWLFIPPFQKLSSHSGLLLLLVLFDLEYTLLPSVLFIHIVITFFPFAKHIYQTKKLASICLLSRIL